MTESRWRRLAGFAALLLLGFHAANAPHGLILTHDCACWDFEHFLLLPCDLPAGDLPVLDPVGIYSAEPAPFAVEAPPSLHSSRGPPAKGNPLHTL